MGRRARFDLRAKRHVLIRLQRLLVEPDNKVYRPPVGAVLIGRYRLFRHRVHCVRGADEGTRRTAGQGHDAPHLKCRRCGCFVSMCSEDALGQRSRCASAFPAVGGWYVLGNDLKEMSWPQKLMQL
eukprot:3752608-Pleurochrysis_carterae.AAC.2